MFEKFYFSLASTMYILYKTKLYKFFLRLLYRMSFQWRTNLSLSFLIFSLAAYVCGITFLYAHIYAYIAHKAKN